MLESKPRDNEEMTTNYGRGTEILSGVKKGGDGLLMRLKELEGKR